MDNGTQAGQAAEEPQDTSNVIEFTGLTKLDLPVEKILRKAHAAGLSEVVILGFDRDGDEFFASSRADAGSVMFHLSRAMHGLNMIIDRLMMEQDDD